MPFIPIGMRQLCLVTGLAIICLSYAAEAYSKPEDHALHDVDFDESSLSLIQKSMQAGRTQQLEDPGVQAAGLKVEHWVDPETIDTDAIVDDVDDVVSEHKRMVGLATKGVDLALAAKKDQLSPGPPPAAHTEERRRDQEGSNDWRLQMEKMEEEGEEEGDEALAEGREEEKDEALAEGREEEKAPDVRRADEADNLAKLNEEVLHQLTPTENIYLDTVRDTLTGAILRTPSVRPGAGEAQELQRLPFNKDKRYADAAGTWCDECFTMVGGARLENVRSLVQQTILERIPGDFLEAGSWRGGCSIMARVVQKVFHQGSERKTWVCDSFSGLPPSSQKVDTSVWTGMKFLEVSQEEVEDNFRNFQALDKNVEFRKGYFSNSLPKLRSELRRQGRQIAVLRGDGDMYESFLDILYNLYEFVPVGGYFICDDCPKIDVSQKAIDEFRAHHHISSPIQTIPGSEWTTYWRKEEDTPVDYSWYLNWNATRIYKSK